MTATIERQAGNATEDAESALRPQTLDEYIGQDAIKPRLRLAMGSAKARDTTVEHVLLYGPPGLGKTTLASIIAHEMGGTLHTTAGPALQSAGDAVAIMTGMRPGDVLFVDEIHRLPRKVEEVLYPAMEDGAVDIIVGKGAQAKTIRVHLPAFTLVGATTRVAEITDPLRDRFGLVLRLEPYEPSAIALIVTRAAGVLDVGLMPDAAYELAAVARGVPRVALRLLRGARDYATVNAGAATMARVFARVQARAAGEPVVGAPPVTITRDLARAALGELGLDDLGLDATDRRVLYALCERFDGGPVGVGNLSAATGEEEGAIEDVIEPYLIQLGFLMRTPRGRLATSRAYAHLGLDAPGDGADG